MKFQSIALAAITSSVPVFAALSSSKTSDFTRDNGNLNPFPIQELKNKRSSYVEVMPAHRAVEADDLQWISTGEIPHENSLLYGRNLAMSDDGETIVVGYPLYDSYKGLTYVYSLENGQWTLKFNLYGENNNDNCGWGLSISGDSSTIAIGCYSDSNGTTGRIKIYRRSGSEWFHETDILGEDNSEQFGYSVDLSEDGNTLIGGAKSGLNGSSQRTGLSRVYRYYDANDNGSLEWAQLGNDIFGEYHGDWSGWDVSLSKNGEIAAIGAHYNDDAEGNAGHTRVYEWTGSSWIQKGQDIDGETEGEKSGYSVSLSDDGYTLAIGAHSYDDPDILSRGVVRVYKWNGSGSDWEKIAAIEGPHSNSQSGYSVSLSGSGDVLAVGEPMYDGGHVRVLMNSGDTWTQVGQTIEGNTVRMGESVALSNDGKTLASLERGNGVYIFKLSGDLPGATSQPSGFLSNAPSSAPSLSPSVAWDGTWFISYNSPVLSDKVLTTTYNTNPGISHDNVVVTLTDGLCNSGVSEYDSSVITGITVNIGSGTLVIAKTIDPAVIAADHNESYDFCETVTLKEDGWEMINSQSQFTLTANFLEEIESYTATLEDNTVVNDVGDVSLDLEGTVTVTRCDGASDNLNPGDRLCLEISENDTPGVVVDSINDLNLQQGAVLFQAITGGNIVLSSLVEQSCENGSCTVYISLPVGLFADETDADTLTLDISGDVYLKEDNGKDSKAENTDAFNYSVQLQKPCEGGSLHGILNKMLS